MEPAQVTPQRPVPPGVGTGPENKDAKYHFISGLEASPFHRLPLSDHNHRAALLSGPQRVPVKSSQQHGLMEQPAIRSAQRGAGNFMKPTESSKLASTPVRPLGKHQSPARSRPAFVAVTPVAQSDSANINQFVSPTAYPSSHQVYSNPLMTPTRAQSTGRSRPSNTVTGSPAALHVITPSTAEAARSTTLQAPVSAGSARKRIALASPPGRVTVASVGSKVASASPKRSVSAGRAAPSTPSYLQPTASSQMLFSPDAAARVQHQHHHQQQNSATTAVEHSPQVARAAQAQGSASRTASAPKARPQSLSTHMQARAEQLLAEVAGASPQAAIGATKASAVTASAAPRVPERPRLQENTAMRSPQPVSSTAAPKLSLPTQGVATAPAAASRSKGSSIPVHSKAARSADVLSANKAAKLAALAAASHAQSHVQAHAPPSTAVLTGAARYAQPTHSSAAATAALLTSSNPNPNPSKGRSTASRHGSTALPQRPNSAVAGGGVGIAARQLHSAAPGGEDAFETPTSTPQRAAKLHKRPPTAPTASSAAAAAATRKPAERQVVKPVITERGTRTIERTATSAAAGKSKIQIMAGKVPAGKLGASKSATSGAQHPASAAAHGDSIMQILEGHDGSFAHYPRCAPAGDDPEDLSRVRRSYSFGSELSCVEAGPDELLSIGASIDFSANNTFDSDPVNLSLHDASVPAAAATVSMSLSAPATAAPAFGLSLRAPNLSGRGSTPTTTTTTSKSAAAVPGRAAGLPQLQLEEGLENVSIVEAPTSFSPSNLSNMNMSGFSQDVITPLSVIQPAAQVAQPVSQPPVTPGTTRWAEEYTAFFPPEISLVSGPQSASLSYAEESSAGVSGSHGQLAAALNYSCALSGTRDDSASCTSPSGMQGLSSVQDVSGVSGSEAASFAPSPLPQNVHPSQHHHAVHHALRPSTASTVASDSDALNQAMLASSCYSMSVSSMPSFVQGMAPLSLTHPGRLLRQFSDQSTCNISAITPAADGTTFNSSSGDLPNLSVQQPSQLHSRPQSRQQVGSSSDSLVSNLLDRAMIASYASYSYEQETSGDYLASESTTSVSPFLRGHMTARSDSGVTFTPVVHANPTLPAHIAVRTMFSPPPPPEIETSLPLSVDNTLTASQQFDSSVDALFASQMGVAASVESLPPPPPPPLEALQSVPESTTAAAETDEGASPSAAERIKQRLLRSTSQHFDALRSAPPTPVAAVAAVVSVDLDTATTGAAEAAQAQEAELSPFPQVPRLPSFGSVHSMSMLCSTDSADMALYRFGATADGGPVMPTEHGEDGPQDSSRPYSDDDVSAASMSEEGDYCGDEGSFEEDGEEEVNLVDDFDSQSPVEDTVNMGDAYSDCDEEDGVLAEEAEEGYESEFGEDYGAEGEFSVAVDDAVVVQQTELSEDEELSDDDADPSELQLVNASIQSMNTSRLAASASSSSVSGSVSRSSHSSYSSSLDELRGVNPHLKSASWVRDNYPRDSQESSGAFRAKVQAANPSPAVLSAAREEGYRSSRHHGAADHYTIPVEESCPDPVAGQLLAMPACLLGSKKSYRTMQSVFVPVSVSVSVGVTEDPCVEEKRGDSRL